MRIKETDPEAPVPSDKIDNLYNLMSWLYGDERNRPVIKESRDITNYLTHVVESLDALKHLERTRDLVAAYELSDAEEQMVIRYLSLANRTIEGVCGLIQRHKTHSVLCEVEKCLSTVERLGKNANRISVSSGT